MIELIKPYGFTSFLDLYRYIQDSALAGEKEIRLEHLVKGKVSEAISLELEYIKARAFDELYDRLPTAIFMQTVKAFMFLDCKDLAKTEVLVRSLDDIPIR